MLTNNYLFFRTDRIGDFLVSAILINSIKRNDNNSLITVVASKKNYFYIKTLDFIDEVHLYPENFLKKVIFFFKLFKKKYKLICTLDGKKRSIYFSLFLKSKFKVLMTTKYFFKNVLHNFFTQIHVFKDSKNKLNEIKSVLKLCNMSLNNDDFYFLKKQKIYSKISKNISNYTLLHFDEKWIHEEYIRQYQSIEPSQKEFEIFIDQLIEKTNQNLIITTGLTNNKILDNLKNKFQKINNNLYEIIRNKKKIYLYVKINFFDLKTLIKDCSSIITCHGAATHVANAFNKKIYDIFDNSQNEFYTKWNSHMSDYNFFHRENFKNLSNKILLKI